MERGGLGEVRQTAKRLATVAYEGGDKLRAKKYLSSTAVAVDVVCGVVVVEVSARLLKSPRRSPM